MAQNRDTFPQYCTLERNKIDFCRNEYFIVDRNAKRIFEIDSKFYNCNLIGKYREEAIESEYIDQYDVVIDRKYDTSFRYFEFSYDIITPKYEVQKDLLNHLGDDDLQTEIIERGNKHKVLKAIITDAGDTIIDEVVEVIRFIPELQASIVKLYTGINNKWKKEFEKAYGEDAELWAVVSHRGEFLFPPFRSTIEYIESLKIFQAGGVLLFDINGNKIMN
jgi:hypothetical protein